MFSIPCFNNRFYKVFSIIGFLLLIIALTIILYIGPAKSYEFSIYDAYPIYFWLALFGSMVIGCGLLLMHGIIVEQNKTKWISCFLLIVISDLILLFMPFIRGYTGFGSGDTLSHIGWMKDIIHTGYLPSSLMYPMDHFFGVILNLFTGLSFQEITMILPAIFSLFFILSFYLLSTVIFSKQSEHLLLLLFASILMFIDFNVLFLPNAQSFMLLPFLLYLLFKSNISNENLNFSLLLIIMCSLLVFFHPLITVLFISILVLFEMISWIQKKMDIQVAFNKSLYIYIFFLIILFFSWSTYLYLLTKTAKPILGAITGASESVSELQSYSNILGQVNFDMPYIIQLIFNTYGQTIILGILSLICSAYVLLKFIKRKEIPCIYSISSICFVSLFIASILMFFFNGAFGFGRIISCALIFSIILIPSTLLLMNSEIKINAVLKGVVIFGILAAIIWFSMFNLYYSPITKKLNQQVTKSEYFGMTTFYQHRDESIHIIEYGPSQERMYDVIYGRDYPGVNVRYGSSTHSLQPPAHFNYNLGSSLGERYYENTYFLLTNQGKFFYQNVYPEFQQNWKFNPLDFERLNYDESVQKIYNNGNLEVRLIK